MAGYPRYEVRLIEGCGCHVLVIRKDGYRETWAGFTNKSEAEIWIAEQVPKKSQKKPVSLASAWGAHERYRDHG